jgi:hypothetical protein
MKKAMSALFVLLLAMVMAGVSVSAASAAGGPPVQPYLYTGIDPNGEFINPASGDVQNSMQMVIYNANDKNFIITAHPNYSPHDNNPSMAIETTVVTSIQVYDPGSGNYVNCIVGGTFVVPDSYLQFTNMAGYPYLQFNVTFTKYFNATGVIDSQYVYQTAYLELTSVWP